VIGFVLFAAFLSVGCATSPVEYSLTPAGQPSATIGFLTTDKSGRPSVSFASFDGRGLPRPERKTHWDPIVFPAGRELRITVRAVYEENDPVYVGDLGIIGNVLSAAQGVSALSRNVNADVEFICPPLAPDRRYQLSFRKGPGMPGTNTLYLTDIGSGRIVFHHDFEVSFGGFSTK